MAWSLFPCRLIVGFCIPINLAVGKGLLKFGNAIGGNFRSFDVQFRERPHFLQLLDGLIVELLSIYIGFYETETLCDHTPALDHDFEYWSSSLMSLSQQVTRPCLTGRFTKHFTVLLGKSTKVPKAMIDGDL